MDCKEAQSLVSAYVDDELDARSSLEVEQHLATCKGCEAALNTVRETKRIVKGGATYFQTPASLRESLKTSVVPKETPTTWAPATRSLAFAACMLIALGVGFLFGRSGTDSAANVGLKPPTNSAQDETLSDVFASHIRALMSGHLADVISTDKHTVKPWFNGRVDFSPPVNDFVKQGFPLIGGRLEYLDGKRVAVLVYKRAKHVIDLYIAPASGVQSLSEQSTQGYNEIHWKQGGFEFWAISDLNMAELKQFAGLCQS